jgi:hypothetical protein
MTQTMIQIQRVPFIAESSQVNHPDPDQIFAWKEAILRFLRTAY